MKINFCNLGKKAILKKTQLIYFLKEESACFVGIIESKWTGSRGF
jgi:hypothetical protein